jgi:ubiquinone/menaquinone biosynthesis C-methylase UbiE/uncharacterized protein YbaR (Trm112 family)
VTVADVRVLACPACRGGLDFRGTTAGEEITTGALRCEQCNREWPVEAGLPRLFDDDEVRGFERVMRLIYDAFAPFHDAVTRFVVPVMQCGMEASTRNAYMRRLDLPRLAPKNGRRPVRILEIGIGTGANVPLVERLLPRGLDVELWGVDYSRGMIEQCRRRLARHEGHRVRLVLADAHALPFRDREFDRVFHVGGIATYRDPRRALAEMARVARPGTPIVVVDERLDPSRPQSLYHRLMFRALTFYDPAPASPRAYLPEVATDVIDEQASRFYYCLRFSIPARRRRTTPVGTSM